MIEFLFDTTRAVVDLILNGVTERYRNVRFIVPHGGATLPMVADRVAAFAMLLTDGIDASVGLSNVDRPTDVPAASDLPRNARLGLHSLR